MRYGSVCSGIEAATMAWHPLGWEPAFFSEIEKFPREVLAHHYPDVPLHGDFTTIKEKEYGSIDLLVGGTPCQSFSIAGLRGGLDDDRGNLALEFIRLAQREKPRWVVWENVPGVLSSNKGRDFGTFLGALGEIGYGFAYRVLDAQYFGVAQRRRRVFVVGYLGDWRRAAAVLFERESMSGNPAPSRETGKEFTEETKDRARVGSEAVASVSPAVSTGARFSKTGNERVECDALVTARMVAFGEYSTDGSASALKARDYKDATDLVAFQSNANAGDAMAAGDNISPTMRATGDSPAFATSMAVRRLTPIECERLQGFPDDFTNIKEKCPDGPRYKALGNSMAVPVMNLIGKRIDYVDSLL